MSSKELQKVHAALIPVLPKNMGGARQKGPSVFVQTSRNSNKTKDPVEKTKWCPITNIAKKAALAKPDKTIVPN